MDEVVNCEHLNKRQYFEEIRHPEIEAYKCPGAPVRFSKTRWDLSKTAPNLSEHNPEVYGEHFGYSKEQMAQLQTAGII